LPDGRGGVRARRPAGKVRLLLPWAGLSPLLPAARPPRLGCPLSLLSPAHRRLAARSGRGVASA
jgi:hypothetical protein